MTEKKETVFNKLNVIDVNKKTKSKNGLTYLAWAWAWAEVKRLYPDATYTVHSYGADDSEKRPYLEDENLGYMVSTDVTIDGQTLPMHLPVMNHMNKAQKSKDYTFKTKSGETTVDAATMFDINTAIMRCLVKNLAMFGLGLYIYAGEDLPVDENGDKKPGVKKNKPQF